MLDPVVARGVLAVYSLLLLVGGVMGYLKAKSVPSLVAGIASGLIGIAAVILADQGRNGLYLGAALAVAMLGVFAMRLAKTRKFMPSGMLVLASVIVLVVVSLALI